MRAVSRTIALTSLSVFVAGGTVLGQQARKAVSNPPPAYPELAEKLHLKGTVKVKLVIGADGAIKETQFLGGNPVFVDAVGKALKEWKYAPASSESTLMLEFKF
jgi:outer membrane biosynthesis protein TonB